MKPSITLRLIFHYVESGFCVKLGQGCERLRSAGLCQCRAAVSFQLSSLPTSADRLPLFRWVAGTIQYSKAHIAAGSNGARSSCEVGRFESRCPTPLLLFFLIFFSLFISVFCCSLKLHHHQPLSLSLSLCLSLSLPPSLWLLRNVQLYLLQLRILIFPTRQSARANQEKRDEEPGTPTSLTCPCAPLR